ncbi:MAG TPA: type II toxin-antitoxin system VapB family antitoxin [Deltaproteobacteria bacterium]|nr:type II toxin-antitoxin system VapB family antitoxin [Deltaproteobacteria bacterium]
MATNLAIDTQLIEEARIIGKSPTKKAVVTEALIEYIQRRKQMSVIDLFNTIEYDSTFNYKTQRKIA